MLKIIRVICLLFLIPTLLFSNYDLYIHNLKIAQITNLNKDLKNKKSFLSGKITNPFFKFFFNKNKIILYSNDKDIIKFRSNNKIMFKNDKHKLILLLKIILNNNKLNNTINFKNYKIKYNCKLNINKICNYQYINTNNDLFLKGVITLNNNNNIIKIIDNIQNLKLIKN